jgi:hypothetical protein
MLEGLLEDPFDGAVQTLFYEADSFHAKEKAQIKYYTVVGGVPLRCSNTTTAPTPIVEAS